MEDYKKYHVTILPLVLQKISEIFEYIAEHFSEDYAKKRVDVIFNSLEGLSIFPKGGFNADEKFQKKIDKRYLTRGIPIKKDYIALYFIDETNKKVVVTHLLPAKSDYMKLFQ